jgi:hypothetical protein
MLAKAPLLYKRGVKPWCLVDLGAVGGPCECRCKISESLRKLVVWIDQ